MKILMTNHHLKLFRGSETATYSMAVALKRRGHDVFVFTGEPGNVTDLLKLNGVEVTMRLEKWKDEKFDVAHCHHWPLAEMVRYRWKDLPMVYLSHGILPNLERPPMKNVRVAVYAGVSEEVQTMLMAYGYKSAVVMRNAVDCDRFRPDLPVAGRPHRVMALSNHFKPRSAQVVSGACERLGYKFWLVGLETKSVWETELAINKADLVVSLGRGCLEAMACARAVLVYDEHGGDGMMRPRGWEESRKHNFSGRRFRIDYDVDLMANEIVGYSKGMGELNRKYVLENHNAAVEAEKWERLYKQAMEIGARDGTEVELPGPGAEREGEPDQRPDQGEPLEQEAADEGAEQPR